MFDVYIIVHGHTIEQNGKFKDIWESAVDINNYYDKKSSAESYLAINDYEKDSDDIYFINNNGKEEQAIAKIITLSKSY